MSRDYGTGAPIVAGSEIDPIRLGRSDTVTGSDGKKVPIQYGVIEASEVIPSHNADGTKNPSYVDPNVPAFRAITNGRVAGLQAAYNQGTANDYRTALLSDDLHGIDRNVIDGMENPMLVRIMPMDQVNKNTGDVSNTGAGLSFNIVEQAKNDTNRIDLSKIDFTDAGDISPKTVRDFIKAMPDTERGNLIDKQGNPTKQAIERVDAAIFQQAYENDKLTELAFQAQDEEARNIVRALNMAASKAIRLGEAGDYDVRPIVNEAVELAINARRNNLSLSDAARQVDITANPLANSVIKMFADNPRSAKAIGENLSNLFDNAYAEGTKSGEDMFGAVPKRPVDQLINESFGKKVEPDLFAQPVEIPPVKIPKEEPEPKAFTIKKPMEQIAAEIGKMDQGSQVSGWLVENAPNSAARAIAERIKFNIDALEQAGVPIKVEVLNGAKRLTYYGDSAYVAKAGNISYFKVRYNGLNSQGKAETYPPSNRPTGTRYSTIMHEMLHVISQIQLDTLVKRNFKGPEKVIYNELRSIYRAVEQQMDEDIKNLPPENRHPAVQRKGVLLKNIDELWVRSLTEGAIQDYLSRIKMGKKTALTKLMSIFRKVVGLDPEYETALDRIMTVSDRIFAQTPQDIQRLAKERGYRFVSMKEQIADESKPLKVRTDNPGGSWLTEKQSYSESKGRNEYGVPNSFGSVTGYFKRNVLVPVDVLARVKGMRGEQANVRDDSIKFLTDYMGKNDKFPPFSDKDPEAQYFPFIQVYQDGTPYVNEGNHRIMTAKKLGWKFIPLELRYFNGAELEDGPLSPAKIAEYDNQAREEGYSATNYSAKPETVSSKKEETTLKTDTPQFRKFFGDSKVVDENGNPMVMYHGTEAKEDFDIFDTNKKSLMGVGSFFSSTPSESFAGEKGGRVIPAYLSLKNPKTYNYDEFEAFDKNKLIKEGFDGIIVKGVNNNISMAVAFKPNQIKSATGNTGEYSTEDARIQKEEVAEESDKDKPTAQARNYLGKQIQANWAFPEDNIKHWPGISDQSINDFLYKIQDKQIDTKNAQQAIEKAAGEIEENINVYEKEQLYHGRTATGIRKFLLDELMPAIKELGVLKLTPQDLKDYLYNRHAEERNNKMNEVNKLDPITGKERKSPWELQDRASGISTKDARAYLANLEPAKKAALEKVAKRFDEMVQGTQQILLTSGAEDKATIDAYNNTYKHYVPLFRIENDFTNAGGMGATGASKGFGVRGAFSKRAMGSEKEVQDILGNLIAQRERALIRAEKSKVGQALYGLALTNPNPDLWLPVNPDAIKSRDALVEELQDLGYKDAAQIADNLMEEPKSRYISKEKKQFIDPDTGLPMQVTEESVKLKLDNLKRFGDNVFPVRINGKDRYIFFNKNDPRALRMVHSLMNLDADSLGDIEGIIAKATRWFASVNTQYNPIFGVVNLIRDIGGSTLNLSTTAIAGDQAKVNKNVIPAMRGILNVLRDERKGKTDTTGKWAKAFQDFREQGGQTGYRDSLIRTDEEKQIIEREINKMKSGNTKKAFYAVVGALSDFNDMMENSIRLSAYMAALDKGLSKQKAAILAKNLTVNFDKKGQLSARINAYFAFFNASVQGTARLAKTLKGPKGKAIIGGGIALGAAQAVILALAGFDEDEPPEFVRERNFVVPLPDGKFLTIPYPLGFNVLPNVGRLTTEFVLSGGKDPGKKVTALLGSVVEAFSPIGGSELSLQTISPTVVDPLVAIATNKDAFGRPIYKKDQATNPTPGYLRSRENASEFSKNIAYFLNLASGGTKYSKGYVSPTGDEIDYLIGQITGGVGRELIKTEQTVKAGITGEELPAYRIPLVGRFYGETQSNAAESQRFYNNIIKMADHENEVKGRIKNKEPVAEYLRENPQARLWQTANNVENQINALNKQKKEFIEKGLPKDRIKRIENQKAAIMKRFNDQLDKYEE
jgi:hypothetical protein